MKIVYGQLDNTISVMAKEADVTTYVNLGGLQDEAMYDQEMLPHLQQALRDSSKKKLIILHTIGNHWNYARRHPANFNRWQPSLTNKENPNVNDLSLATAINNSYDNSVLYADWFLNSIIGQLRDKPAAMFFVADHGETLPDGNCQQVLHMHNFEHEFRVPAMLWYADSFQRRDPAKISALKTHAKQKLSTENVMPTLLELGDVSLPQTNSARS
ncbi:MAG: sulfatase-like hydrolase/transferase, partial [Burkholderiales bacterium]|nr:sulfatase-like hydrolase/transferase [Burkholderiales bacterium]